MVVYLWCYIETSNCCHVNLLRKNSYTREVGKEYRGGLYSGDPPIERFAPELSTLVIITRLTAFIFPPPPHAFLIGVYVSYITVRFAVCALTLLGQVQFSCIFITFSLIQMYVRNYVFNKAALGPTAHSHYTPNLSVSCSPCPVNKLQEKQHILVF